MEINILASHSMQNTGNAWRALNDPFSPMGTCHMCLQNNTLTMHLKVYTTTANVAKSHASAVRKLHGEIMLEALGTSSVLMALYRQGSSERQ